VIICSAWIAECGRLLSEFLFVAFITVWASSIFTEKVELMRQRSSPADFALNISVLCRKPSATVNRHLLHSLNQYELNALGPAPEHLPANFDFDHANAVKACMEESTPAGNAKAAAEHHAACEREPNKPIILN